jgi:hypothetical protein
MNGYSRGYYLREVLGEPEDEVVVDGDCLALPQRSLSLTCAATIGQIATPGI